MFAGKMNSSFRLAEQHKVSQTGEGPGAARPFIFNPALRRAFLEILSQPGKQRTQLIECGSDAIGIFHGRDPFGLSGSIVSHDDAAPPRLVPGRLPNLHRVFSDRKTIQTLLFP